MEEYATYLDAHEAGYQVFPFKWDNVQWTANPYPNHAIENGNNQGYTEMFEMNEYIVKGNFISTAGNAVSRVTVTGIKGTPSNMGSIAANEFVPKHLLEGSTTPPTLVTIKVEVSSAEFDPHLTVDYYENYTYKGRISASQWVSWSQTVLSGTVIDLRNPHGQYGENPVTGRVTSPITPKAVYGDTIFAYTISRQ